MASLVSGCYKPLFSFLVICLSADALKILKRYFSVCWESGLGVLPRNNFSGHKVWSMYTEKWYLQLISVQRCCKTGPEKIWVWLPSSSPHFAIKKCSWISHECSLQINEHGLHYSLYALPYVCWYNTIQLFQLGIALTSWLLDSCSRLW